MADKLSDDISVPREFDYVASVSGAHPFVGDKSGAAFVSRRIIVNGDGDLWLTFPGSSTEYLVAKSCPAGQQIDIQASGLGASTTATEITALG